MPDGIELAVVLLLAGAVQAVCVDGIDGGFSWLGGEGHFGLIPNHFGRQVLSRQYRKNTVRYTVWEVVRPLANRLVGDADCFGGCGYRAAEQFNGFGFMHALLNHSSQLKATIVQSRTGMIFNNG